MYEKTIQFLLKKLDYYSGKIDGSFGAKSKLALKNLQERDNSVPDYSGSGSFLLVYILENFKKSIMSDPVRTDEISYDDISEFYGKVGENQIRIKLPYKMELAWNKANYINSFLCHEKIAANMYYIFKETKDEYGENEIKRLGLNIYGGCLNVRRIRNGTKFSTHSWGIAIDIDPMNNMLKWKKDKAKLARKEYEPFWQIVEKYGGHSLGRVRDYDWMHFQFASLL